MMNHKYPLQLRVNDIDMLGHLNNTVYFSLLDSAKSRYFEAVSNGNPDLPTDLNSLNIVIANINCNFIAPIFFKESIVGYTEVTKIGKSSFKLHQKLVDDTTGEEKCDCVTVMVGFDPATQTAAPLPEKWIEAIEKFENRNLRNE